MRNDRASRDPPNGGFMALRPKIDPEIAALLPSLTSEELAELEVTLAAEGCRDRLVVWKETGILLDGHNRLAICEKRKIGDVTEEISLPDREHAIQWVIENQLARRNLTDERRAYFRGKEYLNKKHHHGDAGRLDALPSGQNDHLGKKTAETVAAKH